MKRLDVYGSDPIWYSFAAALRGKLAVLRQPARRKQRTPGQVHPVVQHATYVDVPSWPVTAADLAKHKAHYGPAFTEHVPVDESSTPPAPRVAKASRNRSPRKG